MPRQSHYLGTRREEIDSNGSDSERLDGRDNSRVVF